METKEILFEIYKKLLLQNKASVSQFIEDYNVKMKEDPNQIINNLSLLNKEDQVTPIIVVNKMISKIGDMKDNMIFLDPNCKRGSFLVRLHETYGIPKENLFGIDREPQNVALLKKLGYKNVIVGTILDENTILNLYKLMNSMGFKDKKFDIVISNPPYDKSMHLDIFNKCYDELLNENGKICFIQPSSFLINVRPGNDGKVKYYNELRKKLEGHIESIYIENLNKAFGIAQKYPLVIWSVTKQKTNKDIEFKLFDLPKQNISSVFDANLIGKYNVIQSIHNKVSSKISDTINNHVLQSNKQLPNGMACLSVGRYMLNSIGANGGQWSFKKILSSEIYNIFSVVYE